jgi:hypothetical protein
MTDAPPAAPAADPIALAAPAEPAAPETPEAPAEPETVQMTKAEADALRRGQAEAEKRARKLEADAKKAEEKRLEEEGQHRELAEQRQRELEAERAERTKSEREARITRLATKLKFVDPADVIGRVSAEDGADDALAEAALARIAEQSQHLIAKEPAATPEIGVVHTPSAGPTAGDADRPKPPPGKAPLQSLDEANALPQAEVVARMDEVEWLERQEQGRK